MITFKPRSFAYTHTQTIKITNYCYFIILWNPITILANNRDHIKRLSQYLSVVSITFAAPLKILLISLAVAITPESLRSSSAVAQSRNAYNPVSSGKCQKNDHGSQKGSGVTTLHHIKAMRSVKSYGSSAKTP